MKLILLVAEILPGLMSLRWRGLALRQIWLVGLLSRIARQGILAARQVVAALWLGSK